MRWLVSLAFLSAALTAEGSSMKDGTVIKLWSGPPASAEKEVWTERGKDGVIDRSVAKVHEPSITVYLPEKSEANGASVIICPGGGFVHLAIDKEGHDVARWLNTLGVAGIVLKYRLPKTEGASYTIDTALADAQRAVRIVRSRASEWNLDLARVGMMGFSAGGAITALAGTRFDAGNASASDPVERQSSRPGFLVLGYMGGGSSEMNVTKDTPPAFLVHADDDRVPSERSVAFYLALKKAGVPAEMHIYAKGGHGYGVIDNRLPISGWPQRCAEWMTERGLLRKR
ncbi:MAG: alpha/beta hydrolase [Bryobacterales bacterium]|nr:alpha/beta hydrolase [Bryobacterales bacterium]